VGVAEKIGVFTFHSILDVSFFFSCFVELWNSIFDLFFSSTFNFAINIVVNDLRSSLQSLQQQQHKSAQTPYAKLEVGNSKVEAAIALSLLFPDI
jgi:hypothetical protein